MTREEIVWVSMETADGLRVTAEHAYRDRVIKPKQPWQEEYIGATTLCNRKRGASEDGESFVTTDKLKLDGGKLSPSHYACKRCLKLSLKRGIKEKI
jgi:hypothetical protein